LRFYKYAAPPALCVELTVESDAEAIALLTLRDGQAAHNLAKRLDRSAFTAAFPYAN